MLHKIQDFTRGIHNKLHSMYLRPNEAVDVLNINIDNGILNSSKDILWEDVNISNPVKLVDKDSNDIIIDSSTHNMVKQLHSRIYNTNIGEDSPVEIEYNGVKHLIPLEKLHEDKLVLDYGYVDANNINYEFEGDNAIDFKQEDITLAVTKYNTKTGYESAPIFKTIDSTDYIDLPHKDYDGSDVGSTVYELTEDFAINESDLLHYIDAGKIRLKRVRSENRVTGGVDYAWSDQVDVFVQYWMQDATEHYEAMWVDLVIEYPGKEYGIAIDIARKATDRNMTDDYREKLYQWLYDKKFAIANRYRYEYEYQPSIKSIIVNYLDMPDPNSQYNVYILGKFNNYIQTTEYELVDGKSYGSAIIIQDDIMTGQVCPTTNQIDSLNVSMFAVSTTNLWLVENNTNRVWYTVPGSLDIINSVSYVSLPTVITGVHYVNNTLVVFCADNSIHSITGMDREDITLRRLADDIDCVHVNTINRVTQTLIWLSSTGLCATNGFSIQLLNRDTLSENTFTYDGAIISSSSSNDDYYLLLGEVIWHYNIRNRVLLKYNSNTAKKLWLYKGEVHAHNGGTLLGKLFSGSRQSLYYKTGNIVIPDYTTHKEFQYFRVSYIGQPTIKIYMGDILVTSIQLPSSDTITHEAFQVKEGVVGYDAHLEILGVCNILNIQIEYDIREEQ